MGSKLAELKQILMEIFQFDQADLDFGIYRIMNQKRDEISGFLDNQLLPQVQAAFSQYQATDKAHLQKELDEVKESLQAYGVAPEQAPKYIELKEKLDNAVDVQALENEVYSHLANFFRRYYSNGDFLSLRRYKDGVYAIPYEGEEVKLHWANADQYYIKTTEHLRDYTFVLADGRRVHFKLTDASAEQDNNKATNGKERRFKLLEDEPLVEESGELYIRFTYQPAENGEKQADLNAGAIQRILTGPGFDQWRRELAALQPTEKKPNRTLLDKQLNEYTAKNTFDYFIHKDLGSFLRRELDFYIKNEIMFLDDLDTENEVRLEQYIDKIKVVKKIGHKIIAFLEQLENFQKKLWLKKKFVVDANYCVTLDKVPEELYLEIIANQAQIDEWKRFFAIEEITGDLINPGYTEPLTVEFLKANPYLVLDTVFFSREFKERLLASFDNLEESTDGLLVHSENFQALNLLMERYREQVKCIYIDPPYNTGNDDFLYKDNFQHSSWLAMMTDRLFLAKEILTEFGVLFVSCDDTELAILKIVLMDIYGKENYIESLIWKKRATAPNDRIIGNNHEYIVTVCKDSPSVKLYLQPRPEEIDYSYKNPDNDPRGTWKASDLSANGKGGRLVESCVFPIVNPYNNKEYWPPKNKCWLYNKEKVDSFIEEGRIGFRQNSGAPFLKRYLSEVRHGVTLPTIIDDGGFSLDSAKQIREIFGDDVVEFPKPVQLMQKILTTGTSHLDLSLDFFAGSGTTAHAVINLNRNDGGNRKYILVEMAEYFDTVMKPRIQKIIYSEDWKEGMPVSRKGTSQMFKYIHLESYEDTLNNLKLRRSQEQLTILNKYPNIKEDYLLSYMLDVESKGSASLLNLDRFTDPFNYRMKISRRQETKECVVDLVETFNYLLGLKVEKFGPREKFSAMPDPGAGRPGAVKLRVARDGAADHTFQAVEGINPAGEKALVLWRTLTGDPVRDSSALDAYFDRKKYSTRDKEFSRIYVNGDNNLENLKAAADQWKVLLIEEEFKRLMFDVPDVL